ncbi:MAG TPA: diguanylate cyclase, partial [Thermoanaerobaculia bacterium]
EKVRAIRSGADAFLPKPLDVAAVVRRVTALRERKEQPARRILAVEDDPTTGALLRGILGAAGYEVEICREVSEFEQALFAFEPDLVLMDVQLSDEVSGHDLVRYIRQNERFSTLPVIIVTSDSERRALLEGTSAGADMLITKPVDWDLLLSQIAARLARASVVRELTDRDPLTGILTRGAFDARVRQRVMTGRPAVLALLDLDHFKTVNDTQGHAAGDRVLAVFGALLRRRLRQSDVVARYGGEEFALLVEDAGVEEALELCERLLADFTAAEGLTFSAGLSAMDDSFEEAFRRADAALYEAKREGRARARVK